MTNSKLTKLKELSWGQIFALVDKYQMTDHEVVSKFSKLPNEWKNAKLLLSKGTFQVDKTFDTSRYAELIRPTTTGTSVKKEPSKPTKAATSSVLPKKRGRKGDKISNAFLAITNVPIAIDDFITQHNVSLAVLRQSKRFDNSGRGGTVHVKKHEGVLKVWREVLPTQPPSVIVDQPKTTVDVVQPTATQSPTTAERNDEELIAA